MMALQLSESILKQAPSQIPQQLIRNLFTLLVVLTLKMMPMVEGVMVQMPWEKLDDQRNFLPAEHHTGSANAMLDEMAKWATALKSLR